MPEASHPWPLLMVFYFTLNGCLLLGKAVQTEHKTRGHMLITAGKPFSARRAMYNVRPAAATLDLGSQVLCVSWKMSGHMKVLQQNRTLAEGERKYCSSRIEGRL